MYLFPVKNMSHTNKALILAAGFLIASILTDNTIVQASTFLVGLGLFVLSI